MSSLWGAGGVGLLVGFLFGSIPFAFVLVRLLAGTDVRDVGSGNVGATNAGRVLGTWGGVAVLALDAAKGGVPVGLARQGLLGGPEEIGAAAAVGAVLGHCYTPWLGGRGGKGVATMIGAFGVLTPAATAVGVGILLVVAVASRMMSLASLAGMLALAGTLVVRGAPTATLGAAAVATAVVLWRHRGNVGRILEGTERRLGESRVEEGAGDG